MCIVLETFDICQRGRSLVTNFLGKIIDKKINLVDNNCDYKKIKHIRNLGGKNNVCIQ